MKENVIISLAICLGLFFIPLQAIPCFAEPYLGQRIEIPSSPNPVGSGARAMGRGGAFIAVADDATAASWNPAGLIQLDDPEISFAVAGFHRMEENLFGTNPEASGMQTVSEIRFNYLSAAYPFTIWNRNMVFSVNYQHLYDFTRKWNYSVADSDEDSSDYYYADYDYDLSGSLSAFGIAYCAEITRWLSFGFALNIWKHGLYQNEWEDKRSEKGSGIHSGNEFSSEWHSLDRYSFNGLNINFGLLWEVNSKLAIGAVFKTPFTADLEHEHALYGTTDYINLPLEYDVSDPYRPEKEAATMDMPISYGIGMAYRFSDAFTLSLDIYRTDWGDFVLTDSRGIKMSPITGELTSKSEGIDATHQVRTGAEYLFTESKYVLAICGGMFYDPAPAEGSPDDIFGFSAGAGIQVGRFNFDAAYQYRFGNNIGDSILTHRNFSQDVREHTFYSSVVIHF